jgi:hypothetical protein
MVKGHSHSHRYISGHWRDCRVVAESLNTCFCYCQQDIYKITTSLFWVCNILRMDSSMFKNPEKSLDGALYRAKIHTLTHSLTELSPP